MQNSLFQVLEQDVKNLNLIVQYKENELLKNALIPTLKIIGQEIHFFLDNIDYVNLLLQDRNFIKLIEQIQLSSQEIINLIRITIGNNQFDSQEKTDTLIKLFDLTCTYNAKIIEENRIAEKLKELEKKNLELETELINVKKTKANIIVVDENIVEPDVTDEPEELIDEKELEVKVEEILQYKMENQTKIKDWKWEENQLETFIVLEKNGIETGIHCQATGCGKTYCILKYIGYFIDNHKIYAKDNNFKSKKYSGNIILFTERVNILADLFNFQEDDSVDEINKKHWKEIGICDLDKIHVHNRVTIKKDDWDDILKKKSDKPNLIVINRAYLTRPEMYGELTNVHIGLVLHDECHSSTSNLCHQFLKHCINNLIPVVGFSATPIRTTGSKKSNYKNKNKLLEIYGSDGELKLLTNYNMIYACEKKLILEPIFYWYSIEMKEGLNMLNRYDIEDYHVEAVLNILSDAIEILPNQKIIAWCGTINFVEAWKEQFENKKREHQDKVRLDRKRGHKFLADYELYLDHSKVEADVNGFTDYEKFKKSKGKSILFCAHKHREGSDIPKLDCCIFLDRCKTRSPIPFIQSIGRVLRKDRKDPNKKRGVIIDGIIDSCDEYAKFVVAKIYGYYLALGNVAGNPEDDTKQEKYLELMDMLEFDHTNEKLKVKLNKDKTTIEINSNQIEWKDLSKKFDKILDDKLTEESREIYKFKMLRKEIRKKGFESPEEYIKYAMENDLETKPQETYRYLWDGWYDFLNIDKSIYPESKELWIIECKKYGLDSRNYNDKINKYKHLPKFPSEIYHGFTTLNKELDLQVTVSGGDSKKII